jgi:Fe-S-cluster-containing hydrogenase component 2
MGRSVGKFCSFSRNISSVDLPNGQAGSPLPMPKACRKYLTLSHDRPRLFQPKTVYTFGKFRPVTRPAPRNNNQIVTTISDPTRRVLICSCDDTMPLDIDAVRRVCKHKMTAATQLCGAELDLFRTIAVENGPLTVACTQQAALFADVAAESGRTASMQFANIRETAGWSSEADRAGPKMAALLAAAAEPTPPTPSIELKSSGVLLICGRDEAAVEAGNLLKDHLDVTVLIEPPASIAPPRHGVFPVAKGRVTGATGHFGAFKVMVNDFAEAVPSSRRVLTFGPSRNNARSTCDIILDLTGGAALFAAADLRDGYLRADPANPAAVLQAVLKARDLVGSFEKPHYIKFEAKLCAHARSQRTGCTRCLELCPAGAIAPAGDHVAIDADICAGCGQCAAACPTGAASYALPPEDALMRRLRAMLIAYREAGGERGVVLFHDDTHGAPLIDALARCGDGLPANVLPFAVNEVTQVGLESIAAAFAYGASLLRFLLPATPRHDISGLTRTMAFVDPILSGLGFGSGRVTTIETDDPDILLEALRALPPLPSASRPASFRSVGKKRDVLRLALGELHRSAPLPADIIALPEGAPFGSVEIDTEGCTLCLSCVSACPTSALRDDPERPALRFVEDACVQCGLCQATCPEDVITLVPRINFDTAKSPSRILKEEEPFCCIRCGKPFGVKSSIERVVAKLEDKHWMYTGSPSKLDVIKMCDNCRVGFIAEQGFESYGAPGPTIRTTDDYLREREIEPPPHPDASRE